VARRTWRCVLLRQGEGLFPTRTSRHRTGIQSTDGDRDPNGRRPRACRGREVTRAGAQRSLQTKEGSRGGIRCTTSCCYRRTKNWWCHCIFDHEKRDQWSKWRRNRGQEATDQKETRTSILGSCSSIDIYPMYKFRGVHTRAGSGLSP
jgi:hypothetical protein